LAGEWPKSRAFSRNTTLDFNHLSGQNAWRGAEKHAASRFVAGGFPFWIESLASQLSAAQAQIVTPETLYREFIEFRNACDDPTLKQSYPEDIHHFRRSRRPQASTRDIILSFLDKRYRNVTVAMATELATVLERSADRRGNASEFEKVLIKERLRRYTMGRKRADTYWGLNQKRVQEKYAGFYALLRVDSRNTLRAEPFAIAMTPRDPIRVSAYWLCEERGRVGDLLVNTYRFSGLTVAKSTDSVIEPVSLALLRAPHGRRSGRLLPLVLGGFVVGWKDQDNLALFHSRIALVKLNLKIPVLRNFSEFAQVAKRAPVRSVLERLMQSRAVRDDLCPRFLNLPDLAMSPTDAGDALAGIESEFVLSSSTTKR
jgi:hypothetical protein